MSFEIIDKLNRDFELYYNNGQMKEAVAAYDNDARVFAADKKVYQGLNQIEKVYSDSISNGNTKVILHTGEVIQCGHHYLIEIRFSYYTKLFYKI
jgi:ketosteroid isomerase-like protein